MNEIEMTEQGVYNRIEMIERIDNEVRCTEIVTEIKAIQKSTMRTLLYASVEIGRLLCEAKEKLAHGEWGTWLQDNFSYSQTTANNLMRLYNNYGEKDQVDLLFTAGERMEIFGNLTPSQALALLPLPEPERREFVETHDMSETSVRDIEAEIKARKEAEDRVDQLEIDLENLADEKNNMEIKLTDLKSDYDEQTEELSKVRKLLQESQSPAAQKEKEKKLKSSIETKVRKEYADEKASLQKEADDAKKRAADLEQQLAETEQRVKDRTSAEYIGKMLALENRAREAEQKAASGANAAVQKFAIHFESFQREWNSMRALIGEIAESDASLADKLHAAMINTAKSMSENR